MKNKIYPLVSIVIPSYNHGKFIQKAIDSVINQTYQNWEAFIIDNNSTDETNKILNNYKDIRIKKLKIENDGVIAKSRNLGINAAKGDWIAFLDTDDWWTKDKLETCLNSIGENTDFVYHKLEIINNKNFFFNRKNSTKGRYLNKPILKNLLHGVIEDGNAIGNSSVLVRRDILIKVGGINENKNMVAAEDFNTWLKIAKVTDKFKYLNKKLGFYLVHDTSAQKKDLSISHREAVKEFLDLFNNKQKVNYEVKLRYMSASYNVQNNNFTRAKKDFMFVLKNGPYNLRLRSLIKIIITMLKKTIS